MNKKPDQEADDTSLFRQAIAGSRKLKQDKIRPHRDRVKPVPRQRIRDEQAALEESLVVPYTTEEFETGDELLYSRNGVQHNVMRKLRKGRYPIEAELDLHRLTSEQAYQAMVSFLAHCKQRRIRCVRLIHGKGLGSRQKRPVLKGKVNQWLQQRDDVLAFCSARPVDGGSGAVYVLLRKPQ